MGKATKIWFIVAASLILLGAVMFVGVLIVHNWDFTELSGSKLESNVYEIDGEFNSLSIIGDTEDVKLVISAEKAGRVECNERANMKHKVEVVDGVLKIHLQDTRKWYEHIQLFNFESQRVTVYLADREYETLTVKCDTGDIDIPKELRLTSADLSLSTGDISYCADAAGQVKIRTTTGDIRIEGVTAGSMELSVSTGKTTLSSVLCAGDLQMKCSTGKSVLNDVKCKCLTSRGSTGDIELKGVIAEGKISIERDTGDVSFHRSDAESLYVKTSTGRVSGSLLSPKSFVTSTSTGKISTPSGMSGGKCEIKTSTGDISMTVAAN